MLYFLFLDGSVEIGMRESLSLHSYLENGAGGDDCQVSVECVLSTLISFEDHSDKSCKWLKTNRTCLVKKDNLLEVCLGYEFHLKK